MVASVKDRDEQAVYSRTRAKASLVQLQNHLIDALAVPLLEEMSAAWERGERLSAEDVLARHPEIQGRPEIAVQVIYEEICLRQEYSLEVSPTEVVRRFPHWKSELEVLLDCHCLLHSEATAPDYPSVGETLGDLQLLAELGRGAQGQVFLATQSELAGRPVVVKVKPCDGEEHVSLARLQHTHIVPLYWVNDFPERNLRVLCMPYLGGTTLEKVLAKLHAQPPEQLTGQDLLAALDQGPAGVPLPSPGPVRQLLGGLSYTQAVCWIGACLADALHYAQQRGLVHLDLKPSNVLLAADGQPLLLDFHLAREPLQPGGPTPEWFGGTPDYMSPEQQAAVLAIRQGKPIPVAVDGRSDIYSLGRLLYEALVGPASRAGPEQAESGSASRTYGEPAPLSVPRLERCNPQVTTGLADIIHKCLAPAPGDRYCDGSVLAADLRRHLEDRPLKHVPNRSFRERWRKWRRRRPYDLMLTCLGLGLLAALVTSFALWSGQREDSRQRAETALGEGQQLIGQRRYADAVRSLTRGQEFLADQSPNSSLAKSLASHLRMAQRAHKAVELHHLADALRFLYVVDPLPRRLVFILEASCRQAWDRRGELLESFGGAPLEPAFEESIHQDLRDLAICLADFRVRLRQGKEADAMRREALRHLDEVESLFGSSPILFRERRNYARALGLTDLARRAQRKAAALVPQTAWDHYALGRALMRSGKYEQAAGHLERALKQQPHSFWTNFCLGICAVRLQRHADAVAAYSVCVGQKPHDPECFIHRAQAYAALGRGERAYQDYSRALELRPNAAEVFLARGILSYQNKRLPEALADLSKARALDRKSVAVHYHLALCYEAQKNRRAALASVQHVLQQQPSHAAARELRDRLAKTGKRRQRELASGE